MISKLSKSITLLFLLVFTSNMSFGQTDIKEAIGVHLLDTSFNSIFYSGRLAPVPENLRSQAKFVQYVFKSEKQGFFHHELYDVPQKKSRAQLLISEDAIFKAPKLRGAYFRGYGELKSSSPSCAYGGGERIWTKLNTDGEKLYETDAIFNKADSLVLQTQKLYFNEKTKERIDPPSLLERETKLIQYDCRKVEFGSDLWQRLSWKASGVYNVLRLNFEEDGTPIIKIDSTDDGQKTRVTESQWISDQWEYSMPAIVSDNESGKTDYQWFLAMSKSRPIATPSDRWSADFGVKIGKYKEVPTKVSWGNIEVDKEQDFRFNANAVQPEWREGGIIRYRYVVSFYFENDIQVKLTVNFGKYAKEYAVETELIARGMALSKKKLKNGTDGLNLYTNSNNIDVNRLGGTVYISVNNTIIDAQEIDLMPTGTVGFYSWDADYRLSNSNYGSSRFTNGFVKSVTLTAYNSKVGFTPVGGTSSKSKSKKESLLDNAVASGSAVVIDGKNGYVITNNHVTRGGSTYKVEIDGELYDVDLIREDPNNDLSLLQLEKSARNRLLGIPIAMNSAVGTKVYSAGFPDVVNMGMDIKVTEGIISSVSFLKDPSKYQISCPITSGNSGGALIDDKGNLVGVTQGGYRPDINTENVNAAVKTLYVMGLAQAESSCDVNFKLRTNKIDFDEVFKSVVPMLIYE